MELDPLPRIMLVNSEAEMPSLFTTLLSSTLQTKCCRIFVPDVISTFLVRRYFAVYTIDPIHAVYLVPELGSFALHTAYTFYRFICVVNLWRTFKSEGNV